MSTSIFIKTCSKDLQWLRHCLQSIRKYAIGFDEIVIAADRTCIGKMKSAGVTDEKVIFFKDWKNGYIQQQYVKLHADKHINSEHVLFVDSDCVFFDYFSENSFMRGRKPILMKTRYGNLEGAEAWRQITENAVGWSVEWEYMRRLPLFYKKDSLTAMRNTYPDFIEGLRNVSGNSFSEFNMLGAFIERYESDRYFITDTEEWMPDAVARQFWSWGGISDEILSEINSYLNPPETVPQELRKMHSRDQIGHVLNAMGLTGRGAEIGVAFGENAEQILLHSNLKELILVDPWNYVPNESPEGYGDMIKDWEGCYNYCRVKLESFFTRTCWWRTTSEIASSRVEDESLDFVYIDANHMSPFVDNDLEYWFPKVRPGGVFGGHDYHNYKNSVYTCNVKDAVDKFFSDTDKQIFVVPGQVPSWYVIK